MQATQSSTASGVGSGSPDFVRVRFMSGPLWEDLEEINVRVAAAGPPMDVVEAAGLEHDVSNLLGALGLYAELLAQPGVLNERFKQYASELRLRSESSQALLERLMRHARSENFAASRDLTILPEVVERCRGLMSLIAGRPVRIEYGPGCRWPVDVPAEAVERILANLVKNAGEALVRKGSEDGGILITVEAVVGGPVPRLVLAVADSGCGMSEAKILTLGRAVERDFRGLGLRVVRELVALSGGCVSVASQLGIGTRVAVEWNGIARRHEDGPMRLVEAEAGWIAC